MFEKAALLDLTGFYFGNAQDERTGTGCTVVLCPEGAVCGVDVRGAAPATRETDLLQPHKTVDRVNAVVLSGGSAFGLAASNGVMTYLAENKYGFKVGKAVVPIVVGASLFDLLVGETAYPNDDDGFAACVNAMSQQKQFAQGNVGAGCGCSSAKLLGEGSAMKTGLGYHVCRQGEVVVAAIVAVNALGSVRDSSGAWIAGPVNEQGKLLDGFTAMKKFAEFSASTATSAPTVTSASTTPSASAVEAASTYATRAHTGPSANTTLGVVVTNAALTKAQATHISSVSHDAYARSIFPVHTSMDGDAIFTMSHGCAKASVDMLGIMACEAMQQAIENGVLSSKSAYGLAASSDAVVAANSQ